MLLGVNENNEIMAVGTIPAGLTQLDVPNNIFAPDVDPLDFKIIVNSETITILPKWNYEMKQAARQVIAPYEQRISDLETLVLQLGGVI